MGSMLTPGSVRTELNGGDTQLVSRVEALVDVCGVEGGGGTHTFGVRNDKSKKIKKKKKSHTLALSILMLRKSPVRVLEVKGKL